MKLRLALLLAAAAALTGCGDDIIAVKGKIADPAPQAGAFHTVYILHAYDIASLPQVSTNPNGDFSISYSDGSHFSGNINHVTGAFTSKLTIPNSFTYEIDDAGQLDASGGAAIGATYEEQRLHTDGTVTDWDTSFIVGSTTLSLDAREQAGTHVISLATETSSKLRVDETWALESIYAEQVTTTYGLTVSNVQQDWTRNDIATEVNPDRTASFTLASDGSGSGMLVWNYDHGISQKYAITLGSDGSEDTVLTFEDPGTAVSPDGQGSFHVDAQYVGNGTYTEKYDDGSQLDLIETYSIDGSTKDDFTFDDASTTFTPDLSGENLYLYDGSGNGFWKTHDATGVTQTCTYDFDQAGTIQNLSCTGTGSSAVMSAPAQRLPQVHAVGRD